MSANTVTNIDLGRLTDEDLGSLENFLSSYNQQYKNAEVKQVASDLKPGSYTGLITKTGFGKIPETGKYLLKIELKTLTAKEFQNNDEIGKITELTHWINPANFTDNDLTRIKQTMYNCGIETEDISILANKKLSPLPTLVGCEVKFQVKHNNKEGSDSVYVNVYINGLISKPKTKSAVANSTNEVLEVADTATDDDIPF